MLTATNLLQSPPRRLPVGAETLPGGGVHFRVWASGRRQVMLVLGNSSQPEQLTRCELRAEDNGYFSLHVDQAKVGDLYRFVLDGGHEAYPDPASRFQPEGPFGPSQVIDPGSFAWSDSAWPGIQREGQVIYEMHVGTFTPEGTLAAAAEEVGELADLGVTTIELMPLADFPGRFGWGYDGVDLFAPTRLYGTPDDVRRFVDRSHALGVGVILDVVYNHFGASGENLHRFADHFFSDRYHSEWGRSPNFDGLNCEPVREFYLANAGYWIDEFHFDGLRIDATQQIFDSSEDHILAAIARRVRQAGRERATFLVAENEPQDTRLVRPQEQGGYGLDALWNDDFHHSAQVALFGRNEAYYCDHRGTPQEFISAAKYGYLYQGQWYKWQKQRRGTPTFGLPPDRFVNYLQNHDQIANAAHGLRCHQLASPGCCRAMTVLLLLGPATPMLFQGQEFAASAPFLYFADHGPELAAAIADGRAKFLSQFPSIESPEIQSRLPDPSDPKTFERCKLDLSERQSHAVVYALHRDLLRLRREDPVLHNSRSGRTDGAVLGDRAFVLRYFGPESDDRLLLFNLGVDLPLNPAPEPLLAPPSGKYWQVVLSTENPIYGGSGTPPLETADNWTILGQAAVVMVPATLSPAMPADPRVWHSYHHRLSEQRP